MKAKFHRMTSKAAKARDLCAEIYGVEIADMRKDTAAIHGMYAELEDRGYEWVSAKNEWALMAGARSWDQPSNAHFVFSCDGVTGAEGQYILTEGLRAAGYEIVSASLVFNVMNPDAVYVHIEVKL